MAVEARRTMRDGGLDPNHILMTINRVMEADFKNHFASTMDCVQEDKTLLAAHKIYRISLRKLIRHFGRKNHLVAETLFRWGKNFADDMDELSAHEKLNQAFDIFHDIFCQNHISLHKCSHWLCYVKTCISLEELPSHQIIHGPGPESDEQFKYYEQAYLTGESRTRFTYGPANPILGPLYKFISSFYSEHSNWPGWEHASDKCDEYWTKFRTWQTIRKDKREVESSYERRQRKFDFRGPRFTPLVPLVFREPQHQRNEYVKKEMDRIMGLHIIR